ncbi:Fc.00g096090.m01.CDS01 [Cosmosporella sp. VM-42]
MYHDHNRAHRHSFASVISSWSSQTDDGIIITKHPRHTSSDRPTMASMQRGRQASTCSERSCEGMSAEETRDLWRCMLELQQRYGCYTSARIDVALEAGDEGLDLMPNRFVIDTLNESVVDLPDEGREMLNRYLAPESCPQKPRWKFWKKD